MRDRAEDAEAKMRACSARVWRMPSSALTEKEAFLLERFSTVTCVRFCGTSKTPPPNRSRREARWKNFGKLKRSRAR